MLREPIEMATRCLPRDRRFIDKYMVQNSLFVLFDLGVTLKLFKKVHVDRYLVDLLSVKLFKLVKRRHTHLWDRSTGG